MNGPIEDVPCTNCRGRDEDLARLRASYQAAVADRERMRELLRAGLGVLTDQVRLASRVAVQYEAVLEELGLRRVVREQPTVPELPQADHEDDDVTAGETVFLDMEEGSNRGK